jgi:hypothetical protein
MFSVDWENIGFKVHEGIVVLQDIVIGWLAGSTQDVYSQRPCRVQLFVFQRRNLVEATVCRVTVSVVAWYGSRFELWTASL